MLSVSLDSNLQTTRRPHFLLSSPSESITDLVYKLWQEWSTGESTIWWPHTHDGGPWVLPSMHYWLTGRARTVLDKVSFAKILSKLTHYCYIWNGELGKLQASNEKRIRITGNQFIGETKHFGSRSSKMQIQLLNDER
ncbi:hypothetical protein VNO77_31462 [Canavalia gladiata]|uniref:Uncharacterized protein n=1 Tax=Canavalia gladiata TaxID=3824 RepID=A0AAN9KP72_CANGL